MYEFLHFATSPENIVMYGGLLLIFSVVFAENGVLFGIVLPGESMVFLAGVLCKTGSLGYSLPLVMLTVWLAAFMGYQFGYWFGMRSRTFLLRQPDCWYYKRRNIALARIYYRRFGVYTILVGRYVPVVRTLAPILAGFIQVNARHFLLLNLLSSTIWSFPFILAGYWLGTVIEIPLHYWMFALLLVLLVALLPLLRRFFPQVSVSNKNGNLL